MNRVYRTMLVRTLPLVLALFVSGCAIIARQPESNAEVGTTEVKSAPAPDAGTSTAATGAIISEPERFSKRVAIVLSDRKPGYENVARELGELLDDYSTYDLGDARFTPRGVFANIADADAGLVIAIGLHAATVASAYSQVPVVFCQVFNVSEIDSRLENLKGVATLPPLAMQLAAWQDLNPGLSRVGAIVGSGHEELIEEASRAAETAGLTMHYRISRSDRETLYMFNRLTPDIDGFWLFPDNRVLSPSVLRQIFSYASRHRVQVAVFNPALLDFGAALSATSIESDIAETVVSVARRVVRGDGQAIPNITPLNEIDIQTNPAVIRQPKLAAANEGDTP